MHTLDSFYGLVGKMRTAQREYCRTRSSTALTSSKRLESEVDKVLEELREQRQLQFDGDHEHQ